ncbi:hypothetical protein D3C75_1057460 [compost metagenome]
MKHSKYTLPNVHTDCPASGEQICKKTCRIIISRIQRQPCGSASADGEPLTGECCFTITRSGREDGQLALQALVKPLQQTRADNGF